MRTLQQREVLQFVRKYSKSLIRNCSERTVALLLLAKQSFPAT